MKNMTKKELRELIIQELMARPAGIVKSSVEKVNVNDIADVAQNHYDKLLDILQMVGGYEANEDPRVRERLKIATAIYTKHLLDAVDSGIDPKEIMNRINEILK